MIILCHFATNCVIIILDKEFIMRIWKPKTVLSITRQTIVCIYVYVLELLRIYEYHGHCLFFGVRNNVNVFHVCL